MVRSTLARFRIAALGVALCPALLLASDVAVFRPFEEPAYENVNAFQFSPNDRTLYLALRPERVAAAKGQPAPANAPELLIYVSTLGDDGSWTPPEAISFAGSHKDYEPTLSPDGELMLFNSWRPMPDGTPVTNRKNNLWLSRRDESGRWSEPVMLEGVSKLETEDSYAAITADDRVYYGQETLDTAGVPARYDIYTGRLHGDRLIEVEPFAPAATAAGEGDPWVSPDGRVVVFTRWDLDGDWRATVDLYITFREGDGSGWTEPVPIPYNAPDGPDFAPAASGDGERFYWKQPGGTKVVLMETLVRESRRLVATGAR